MRNHLNWLFLVIFGIALIGCQDDLYLNNSIDSLNKLSSATIIEGVAIETILPSLDVTGSKILVAGVGTYIDGTGSFSINVPSGTIKNVFVYWEGRHRLDGSIFPNGDSQIKVNGVTIDGELIGKANQEGVNRGFVFRAEVTNKGLVSNGANTLSVTDFVGPATANDRADGVGVMVVIDDGTKTLLEIRDGADWAYLHSDPTYPWLLVTEAQTFNFDASPVERKADLSLFVGDIGVVNDFRRPHHLEITIGDGPILSFDKPFYNNSGPQWDTYSKELTIPAGVTKLKVQLFSDPDENIELQAASMIWFLSALSVPTPSVQLARLGNFVWEDVDKDGVQDTDEKLNSGIPGVKVELYTCADVKVAEATTDVQGFYDFQNLVPNDYKVKFYAPAGYEFTLKDAAATDETNDSDADLTTGFTICTTLDPGEHDKTWDAGLVSIPAQLNKLGDFVWHDKNVNGIQDNGEPGITGVKVELLNGNTVINSITTDENGKYEFSGLANGKYCVRVATSNYEVGGVLYTSAQTKWYSTKKNQGLDDAKDSDAGENESVCVELNNNDDLTLDFGFYNTCVSVTKLADKKTAIPGEIITYTFIVENCGDITLSGGVDLYDKMINPVAPYKIANITPVLPGTTKSITKTYCVKATDCGDLVNTVKAVGHPIDGSPIVEFSASVTVKIDCQKPSTLGDKVWFDKDKDGIQDYNESGIKNVKVELYDCTGKLLDTKYSDYYGKYYFSNLSAGDYQVKFYPPIGYTFTKQNQGSNDDKDSDVDPTTGLTTCITLGSGIKDLKWDAGLRKSSMGCTYTQGYWKTHSKFGPAKSRNTTWDLVGPDKENTIFYKSENTWIRVFWTSPSGNVYYNLAHQYMAAELNVLAGTYAPNDVANAITEANTLFDNYTPWQVKYLSSSKKEQFIKLSDLLAKYNEGKIGPGHCDGDCD